MFTDAVEFGDKCFEVAHVAVGGVYNGVVGYVVAKVRHGRLVDGGQPDGFHADIREVVSLLRDS